MLRRAAVALLAAALLTTLPAPAFGKASLQAQVALSGAWTDNILSVPDIPAPGGQPPQSDFYFELRPALFLTTGGPRAVQRVGYTFSASLFATHSEANSYNHRLDWAGFFQLSKTTTLILGSVLSEGRLNSFAITQGSSALTPVQITQPGGTEFFSLTFTEAFAWEISAQWRFLQGLNFSAYYPLSPRSNPDSYVLGNTAAAERAWRKDLFAAELRVDYTDFTELRGPGVDANGAVTSNAVVTPAQRLLVTGALLKWKHDFGYFWNCELDAGFVETNRVTGGGSAIIGPAGLAAIRYLHTYGSVELAYNHTVSPNAIVAQTFEIDQFALRGSLPLGRTTNLSISGTAAYQIARAVDYNTGGTLSNTGLVVADGTLAWSPRVELQIFARYSFFEQFGNPADLAPVPSLLRHNVLLGVVGTFPGEAAARVPTRQGQRVDQSDAVTIPAPHSEPKY